MPKRVVLVSNTRAAQSLHAALCCLREDPPDWLGAAVHLSVASYVSGEDGTDEVQVAMANFHQLVSPGKMVRVVKKAPCAECSRLTPSDFVYCVRLGQFKREFMLALKAAIIKRSETDSK